MNSMIRKGMSKKGIAAVVALSASLLMSGCSTVYRLQTNLLLRGVESAMVPPLLAMSDTNMVCAAGVAQTPLITGMGISADADYDQLAALLYSTGALCSDFLAHEGALRAQRATRANQVDEAKDALYEQQRWAQLSAQRQYKAYQFMEHYLKAHKQPDIGAGCPEFDRDFDEMAYLLGLVTGLEAVLNDVTAKSTTGVPTDIAAKVERAMTCLNNDKWFGVPNATRAAVWNLLPGASEGRDPWGTMSQAMDIGEKKGVRLAHALYAMSAYTVSDDKRLREGLQRMAKASPETGFVASKPFAVFDQIGLWIGTSLSDRLWTESAGTRTPMGALGTFPGDKVEQPEGVDINELL